MDRASIGPRAGAGQLRRRTYVRRTASDLLSSAPARLGLVAVVAVVVATSSASGALARNARAGPCKPFHRHTLVADHLAQIYTVPETVQTPEGPEYVGCAFGRQRHFVLGAETTCSATGCTGTENIALAGTVVAYERFSEGFDVASGTGGGKWHIIVRDLRTGRALHDVLTGTMSPLRAEYLGIGPTSDVVVKPDGSLAWIAVGAIGPEYGIYQVHALDASGSRTLAVGPSIGPTSLALAGSTLYWSEGGHAASAPLG